MSLLSARRWATFVEDLRTRPLADVCVRYGIPLEAAIEELIATDPGGRAQDAPWWPEVLRERGHASLRTLARRFGTEPRRLRRALAREGLRSGGVELNGRGEPALAAFRDRLGTEADATIAREAGVSVEGVQGERRRLGIPAFAPGRAPLRLTPDEEAWIRGPEPMRRTRPRTDAAASLEVVRRPRSSEGPRRGVEETVPSFVARPSRPPAPSEEAPTQVKALALPRAPELRTPDPARLPPLPRPTDAHRFARDFFRPRESSELERLLQPAPASRESGNKRIVRVEAPRPPRESPPTLRLRAPALLPVPAARPVDAPARPVDAPTPPVDAAIRPVEVPAARAEVPAPRAEAPASPESSPTPSVVPLPTPAAAPSTTPVVTWHVHVPGVDVPMVIHADTAWNAAQLAAGRLPPDVWREVGIVLAEVDTGVLAWDPVPSFG